MVRRTALAAVVAFLVLIVAAPAHAASGTYDCATLQAGLNQVADGDVITLDGMCNQPYDLPSFLDPVTGYTSWTLRGVGGNDGFDGSGLTEPMLTGNDSHRVVIDNLTFRDALLTAQGANGGAIELTGVSGLQVFNSGFFNNVVSGRGGAIHVGPDPPPLGFNSLGVSLLGNTFGSTTAPGEGNEAMVGGAVSVRTPGQNDSFSLNSNTFANNTASSTGGAFDFELDPGGGANVTLNDNQVIANRAGRSGGGGHLIGPIGLLRVDNSLYQGNSVEPVTDYPPGDHFGGGLDIQGGLLRLRDNTFRANSVKAFPDDGDYGGGALAVRGPNLNAQSEYTRIESNSVAGHATGSGFDSEGGGLFFSSDGGSWQAFLDAIAGNSVGAGGEGGGIYTGSPSAPTTLRLAETTVAGNSSGGQFAGIAGDPQDDLTLWNSIVFNGPQPDIGGFDFFDVQYSDACRTTGGAFTGPGNICADPRLAGGTDIHQTKQSPTIDKGSDELYNSVGGERAPEDFEGDPRPTDGDGDGHTVDMGADETPAGFTAPPVVVPPAKPQCSDGRDNDSDGAVDLADPGCLAGPADDNEGDETQRDLFLCGKRKISLVRADLRGGKVVLSGLVAASVADRKIELSVRYIGVRGKPVQLGSVRAKADGSFRARVNGPPRKLFVFARYRAKVGKARSVELKLPQSLASTSIKRVGTQLVLRGKVDRALLGKKRGTVVIRRILCGRYRLVGQAKPNARGVYAVRFPAPPRGGAALYRAESKVLARPGSKRYVKQFARAIAVEL